MLLLAQTDPFTAWQIVVVVWLFGIGAAIGSFLNVVIYRVPLGLSVVHPPSHCPSCKRPIRAYDNLPILSWFVLRGRCRRCGARFSARYALVELGIALVFAMLGAQMVAPHWPQVADMVNDRAVSIPWCRWGLAVTTLATLWTYAMIERDGHRSAQWPTSLLMVAALVVGISSPQALPTTWLRERELAYFSRAELPDLSSILGCVAAMVVVGIAATILKPVPVKQVDSTATSQRIKERGTAILWAGAGGAMFGVTVVAIALAMSAAWWLALHTANKRLATRRTVLQKLVLRIGLVDRAAYASPVWLVCFAEMLTVTVLATAT